MSRQSHDDVHYFSDKRTVVEHGTTNLALEKIELSWPLVKVFGGIAGLIVFVVWATLFFKEFQHSQELRWAQITALVQRLSDSTEKTNSRLEAISLEARALRDAPDLFRVGDLPNLCALLTNANQSIGFKCPEVLTQIAVDARFKRNR